jgi:hypothetical protein
MKIEDNFLEQEVFDKLQKSVMGQEIPWHFTDYIDRDDNKALAGQEKDNFQFVHLFYQDATPQGDGIARLNCIIQKLKPVTIFRIKANLLIITPNIVVNNFHSDISFLPEEQQKQWTTSIFYVNTNNGYTEFEDGTKVESVANRMVIFPSNMKHRGTSCTDEKTRVVINFNYVVNLGRQKR